MSNSSGLMWVYKPKKQYISGPKLCFDFNVFYSENYWMSLVVGKS